MNSTFDNVNAFDAIAVPLQGSMADGRTKTSRRARIIQIFSICLVWPIFNFFFFVNIKGREHILNAKGPLLIIANHISFYDSFIFRLLFRVADSHLPLRFIAVKKFDYGWLNMLRRLGIIGLIYRLCGVLVIEPGKGVNHNLHEAKEVLAARGNLVMYPEGKIVKAGTVGVLRRGAALLAIETGVPVIPVSFRFAPGLLIHRHLHVNVGKSIEVPRNISVAALTATFHETLKDQYQRV